MLKYSINYWRKQKWNKLKYSYIITFISIIIHKAFCDWIALHNVFNRNQLSDQSNNQYKLECDKYGKSKTSVKKLVRREMVRT